ncbi:MAG: SHOCT domain-containing protein [Desulfobacteraceae bacterium]
MASENKLIRLMIIFVALGLISGCATIIHGTTQEVAITTDPSEADLVVDGRERYKSPAKITMKRKEDHMVEVTKDGYQKETVNIKSVLSGAVAGNIIAGGLIGWGIDAASGGQYRLVPDHVDLRLRPLSASEASQESIEVKLDQLRKLQDRGKITADEYTQMRRTILENSNKAPISPPPKETKPSSPPPFRPAEASKPEDGLESKTE